MGYLSQNKNAKANGELLKSIENMQLVRTFLKTNP